MSLLTCKLLKKPYSARERASITALVNEAFMEDAFFKRAEKRQRLKLGPEDAKGVEDLDAVMRRSDFIACFEGQTGEMLGCIRVEVDSLPKASFGMLSVPVRNQRRGIGSQLVIEAENWARERKCSEMEISVVDIRQDVLAFYAKLGYKSSGQAIGFDEMLGGDFLSEEYKGKVSFLIMVKSLSFGENGPSEI